MWANAQRDGRPAEYRWHPLFNAAKCGWHPILECCAVTRWNLQGCPKLANWSQPLVGRKFTILWGHVEEILLLNKFLSGYRCAPQLRRYSPTNLCDCAQMVIYCILYFQRAVCSTIQTCILNSYEGHTIYGSMVDIQSPTAVIKRGKEEERRRKKKPQSKNIMLCPITHGGHK